VAETLRTDIAEPPRFMRELPIFRGYPVPWFVEWIKGEPEFRAISAIKMHTAINERRCWVCGGRLFEELVFVIGPMCSINRISGEPPCHRECARYAAINCPFLSRPQMTRRTNDLPQNIVWSDDHHPRNPGASAVWFTRRYKLIQNGNSVLFHIGKPFRVEWYAQGREATRAEVIEALEKGIPIIEDDLRSRGVEEGGWKQFAKGIEEARATLPR
jgi:hypothetical protein